MYFIVCLYGRPFPTVSQHEVNDVIVSHRSLQWPTFRVSLTIMVLSSRARRFAPSYQKIGQTQCGIPVSSDRDRQ
jgi:hypothetical protein